MKKEIYFSLDERGNLIENSKRITKGTFCFCVIWGGVIYYMVSPRVINKIMRYQQGFITDVCVVEDYLNHQKILLRKFSLAKIFTNYFSAILYSLFFANPKLRIVECSKLLNYYADK